MNSPLLLGKRGVITGAGSGIGRAAAEIFAQHGAEVIVAELLETKALEVAQEIQNRGGKSTAVACDIGNSASVDHLFKQCCNNGEKIDFLFNTAINAKMVNTQDRCAIDLDEKIWDEIQRVALKGPFLLCRAFGRKMVEQGFGSIILTSTVDALVGAAGIDAYSAAKGGVVSMTRSFAAAVSPKGVRVNCICPGFVETEPQKNWLEDSNNRQTISNLHLLPISLPEEIANFALFLASDLSKTVTGGIYPVDAGYTSFKSKCDVLQMIQQGSLG